MCSRYTQENFGAETLLVLKSHTKCSKYGYTRKTLVSLPTLVWSPDPQYGTHWGIAEFLGMRLCPPQFGWVSE